MIPSPALLRTATEAAQAAAETLRDLIDKPRDVREKAYLDVVTDADLAADRAIQAIIKRDWSDHHILSEESELALDPENWSRPAGYWWIIDPVDGTSNFARGVPSWSISIAVADGDDLQAAVVYDVLRDDLFAAAKGQGTTRNGQPTHTNDRDDLRRALCNHDWPIHGTPRTDMIRMVTALLGEIRTLRCWGTTALGIAHVAAGYTDAYFRVAGKPWDMAAGVLLVEEAGGIVTRVDGSPWDFQCTDILASNRPLHGRFAEILAGALTE